MASPWRNRARHYRIGGESTRPGAPAVSTEEEMSRVIPVIKGLASSVRGPHFDRYPERRGGAQRSNIQGGDNHR